MCAPVPQPPVTSNNTSNDHADSPVLPLYPGSTCCLLLPLLLLFSTNVVPTVVGLLLLLARLLILRLSAIDNVRNFFSSSWPLRDSTLLGYLLLSLSSVPMLLFV